VALLLARGYSACELEVGHVERGGPKRRLAIGLLDHSAGMAAACGGLADDAPDSRCSKRPRFAVGHARPEEIPASAALDRSPRRPRSRREGAPSTCAPALRCRTGRAGGESHGYSWRDQRRYDPFVQDQLRWSGRMRDDERCDGLRWQRVARTGDAALRGSLLGGAHGPMGRHRSFQGLRQSPDGTAEGP
jgi:hypothetical protein